MGPRRHAGRAATHQACDDRQDGEWHSGVDRSRGGPGHSGTSIAAELADGTTPDQIACMVGHWGIAPKSSDPRFTYVDVRVPLAAKFRT